MKRYVKTKSIIEETWDIEIVPASVKVTAASILDTQSNEYQSFIEGMISAFEDYGYELYNDPEYTHKSNKGSDSWYYTFLRIENYVEIRVVVNVSISDHDNKDRPWATAADRRSSYVNKAGDKLADEFNTNPKPLKVPVQITFNDEHFRSYNSALFYVHDTLEDLEADYMEWREANNLDSKEE